MCEGFFSINRSIFDSWVFADPKALKIWIWMIGKARHKKGFVPLRVGKGMVTIEVDRGQFIFGRNKASEALFMDGQFIYRKIKEFEKKEMIKIDSNKQYSIVTICKYNDYQSNNPNIEQPLNKQQTSNEQALNNGCTTIEQPVNTNNNVNKENNVNNIDSIESVGDKSPTHPAKKKVVKTISDREQEFRSLLWGIITEKRPKYKNDPNELKKFFDYWTECSPKGKKMKFEKQKTFDPAKRLDTWFANKRERQFSFKKDALEATKHRGYKVEEDSEYDF